MKNIWLVPSVRCRALVSCVKSQEADNIWQGALADHDRSEVTGTNMFAMGGRLGFGILAHTLPEADVRAFHPVLACWK